MTAPVLGAVRRPETMLERIDQCVEAHPESLAIVFKDVRLTRALLDAVANGIAHYLIENCGVTADVPVAMLMERSHHVIAAMLGITKAGGCFVSLDTAYPADRIRTILRDSGCRAVLTSRYPVPVSLAGTEDVPALLVEDIPSTAQAPDRRASPDELLYILYTSGSTGKPKGVLIEHRSMANLVEGLEPILYRDGGHRVREALSAPFAFDAAAQQVFSCLSNGATLFVASTEVARDPAAFLDFLDEHAITHCNVVSPLLATLIDLGLADRMPASLRRIVTGGESVPLAGIKRFFQNQRALGVVITNMYGPTENCVDSTYFDITAGFDAGETSIPIGIPIPGTEVLVLDENMQRTPDGELGEICVAGLGLARGYLNDPALTAERFVAHPFESGQRIYRTSDWGRWRCDGNLEFHGRFDNQVKIRGYRVELDEIGTQMEHLDGIRRAVAVARGKSGPNVTLVAFYESQTPLDSKALRKALACSLPPWMLPSEFVWSASLPSTSNGKIDRRKLQEMLPSAQRRNEPASVPATDLERKLTQAFCSVLGQDDVRVTDDFFELGGDSLKSAQLLGRIRTDFGVRLAFADFMEHRTVRRVAGRLKHASQDNSTIAKAAEHASYELSHAQKRIWLLHQMPGGNSAYNIPMVFGEDGTLDLKRLEHAFRRLIGRHESLRTSFRVVGHEPRQFIELSAEFMVSEADFRGCVNAESLARSLAEEEAAMSFSLDKAPLMRARLVRVTEERTLLLLTVHHIITDGWSLTILFRELSALYSGAVESELPATRIRYRDYSEWHNARRFDREREYWTKQLEGVPSHLRLPYDFADQSGAFQGASEEAIVPHAIARALRRVAERRQTTMSLVVLAIFQMFLYRLTKQPDFCVGLGVANRSHSDLEHVVGFFVNVVPIRALFSEDQSVEATIDQLISRSYEAFDHQDYPIDLMVRDLAIERIGSSQPLFNVMFAFQNFSELTLPGDCDPGSQAIVHASRLERHAFETSKFNLTLFVWDHGTELRWMLEYDTRRFRPTTARRYLSFLTSIAKAVGDNIS